MSNDEYVQYVRAVDTSDNCIKWMRAVSSPDNRHRVAETFVASQLSPTSIYSYEFA